MVTADRSGTSGGSMKRRFGHLLWVQALAATVVLMLALPAFAIVYGEPDEGRHPFVGSMLYDFDEDGELDQLCSGTLIAPDVFLTASHCTAFLDSQDVGPGEAAVTFDDELGSRMKVYHGTAYTHPDFGFSGPGGMADPHDIAVIVFNRRVPISPAELPEQGVLDELKAAHLLRTMHFTAVGYGTVRETRKGAFDSILDNTERRFAVQDALALTNAWLTLSMNEATGDGGTCYGDSGGPHFLGAGEAETKVVVSITVTGDAVCKATDKTYRVDTQSARAFLGRFVTLP